MCGFRSTNLLDVTLPDGRFIEYVTDGRHQRIAKKVNGAVVRRWVYQDQLNPTAELDGNGTVLYRYAYGSMAHSPDFVVNATGETYRVIRDQLGSPLLVVNIHDEDDILLEARYSAFGNRTVIAGDGSALTLGFAGRIYDEDTGLTRFGARDYDAAVGRWTSKDPILWGGGQGNLYVYVGGDPVNGYDPTGLWDAFAFYAREEGGSSASGVHLGGEWVTIVGYSSESGPYDANIGALGGRIGGDYQYLGLHGGIEVSDHGLEGILLVDVGLFKFRGAGVGVGAYKTHEDHGGYVFASFGHNSICIGVSTFGWWDALKEFAGCQE